MLLNMVSYIIDVYDFFTEIEEKHKEGSVGKPTRFCLFAIIYGRDLNS